MSVENEFQRQAIVTHVAQQLAGPARAITGFQELMTEQARDLGLDDLMPDLERVGAAAKAAERPHRQADRRPDGLPEARRNRERGEATARSAHAPKCHHRLFRNDPRGSRSQNHSALAEDVRVMLAASGELLAHVDAIAGISRNGGIEGLQVADRVRIDAARARTGALQDGK